MITVSHTGYIKRTAITTYRNQRRGGKGRIGMRTREEDFVSHLFVASTHAYILIFTDRGRVYWLKVHEIPEVGRGGQGQGDREPRVDGGRTSAWRRCCGPRVPEDRQVHRDGHAPGRDQEDAALRVLQPAAGGHHRHGRRGRRRADRRRDHATATARSSSRRATARRSGSPRSDVRPMGRTAYGVRGIDAARRRRSGGDGGAAAGRAVLTRHRERLRQADRASTSTACQSRAEWVSSTSRPPSGTAGSSASRA